MTHAPSPVFIQSSKLIEWLLNRKLLQSDYPKRLNTVQNQWRDLADNLSLDLDVIEGVPYLHALASVAALHAEDSSTDFFGRSNPVLRSWKDLIASYEKRNLHIAELSEAIHEIASVSVPRCKTIISDRQKSITDLRQKIKEQSSNASLKEDLMMKMQRELHIEASEKHVKLHLLKAATELPHQFNSYLSSLKPLENALELYRSMCSYVFKKNGVSETRTPDLCYTLSLLLDKGHVTLYEWKYKVKPERIKSNDSFLDALLAKEQQSVESSTIDHTAGKIDTPVIIGSPNDIVWTDTDPAELDFELIDSPNEPDLEIELEDDGMELDLKTNVTEAFDKEACLLLDTIEGRFALMNDLTELNAFLTRLIENCIELHGLESSEQSLVDASILTSAKAFTGSMTIPSNIMQNAPQNINNVSIAELAKLLSEVEQAQAWLTDSSRSQLFLVRNKPGHLDRLMSRLSAVRTQVERARGRVAEAQLRIGEAQAEQDAEAKALIQYRSDCKTLTSILEKELTKLCNRPVQIVGQVLDL